MLVVDTFADKAAVQSAVTTAIADAKVGSDARIAEAALVVTATSAVATAEATPTQGNVDAAQALVTALPGGAAKTALQGRITAVQAIIDATAAVATAEATPTQGNVDAAQALVTALPGGAAKTALQGRIVAVQAIIDALATAKASVPADLTIYTDATALAVTNAMALPETTTLNKTDKTTAIDTAVAALVLKSDLTDYELALGAVHEADYTAGSWTTYQGVVTDNVVTVANTQAAVNTATGNITAAQGSLITKLVAAKTAAISALQGYKVAANYRAAEQTALAAAIADGTTAINAAGTTGVVTTALDAAKLVIDGIKTDVQLTAEELVAAKTAAKADVATALKGYAVGDYTEANWTALNAFHTDGDIAIDAAGDLTAVATAKTTATNGMAGVAKILVITGKEIAGITAPVTGATPVTVATATDEYTATVTWSSAPAKFAVNTVYTASITITPKTGYKLTGVSANFFTVAGATATNSINSGVVAAVFSETVPIQLTIAAPTLTTSKTYNGGTTAAVTAGSLTGVVGSDVVTVTAVANYDTAAVGTGKPITVVYTLGGADAAKYVTPVNYSVATGAITTATITAIATVSGTAQVSVVLTAGTLTPADATVSYQWQISADGTTYADIVGATTNKYTPVAGDVGKFIKVVATGTGSYTGTVTSTATASVANADQAAPTGLVGVAPSSSYGLSDGKITGTTTAMEYKLSTATDYTTATGTEITGLAAGTYDVRYAAKTGFNASPATSVTVSAYVETLLTVTAPSAYTISGSAQVTEAQALTQLSGANPLVVVTTTTPATTTVPIVWSYATTDNGGSAYTVTTGAKNVFRWTITLFSVANGGVTTTGTVTVTNATF